MSGVVDQLIEKLDNFFGRFLFAIERLICLFVNWLQQLFGVFTGITPAKYNNEDTPLISVFFGNKIVNAIYWGMAAIGIVMVFIFTIMAVVKKGADLDDKMRQSHGQILRSFLRSIIIILSLSLFMTITISFTNVLMDSVNDVFNNSSALAEGSSHIEYTDEQFAAMARVFNTAGNYSLNPSYNNRYNLNCCYNEIRGYLKYLADTGVFNYYYTTEENGQETNTWQSVLQELAVAADYNKEQPVDTYNESIANALNHCMQVIKNDNNFHALEKYDRVQTYSKDKVALDRVLFLSGTMGIGNSAAARNDAYNKNPDMLDNVRAPYYTGDKSIYDLDQVNEDFYVSFSRMNYLLIYLAGIAIVVNMAIIIVNCIVRIFNLLFLYVIAPPIIAVSPLDDGGKFKQWLTAFIIQAFSVFATVISMRIFLIFIPIVMNPNLQLVENPVINTIGKLVMIWAGTVAIEKANGLLTGILADNAGWQSIMAGSTAQDVKGSTVGRLASAAETAAERTAASPFTAAAGKARDLAKGAAGVVGRTAALPFRPLIGAVSNSVGRLSSGFRGAEDKLSNSLVESPGYKQRQAEATEKQAAAQDREDQQKFRKAMGSYFSGGGNGKQPPRGGGQGAAGNGGRPGGADGDLPGSGRGFAGGDRTPDGGANDDDNIIDNGARDENGNLPDNENDIGPLFDLDDFGGDDDDDDQGGGGGLPANERNNVGGGADAAQDGAGQGGRNGGHPAGGAQRHYPPNLQKLFGVDENGNPVRAGQAGRGGARPARGADNAGNAGANAGGAGQGGRNGARPADGGANDGKAGANKGPNPGGAPGRYSAETQKLFGIDENGNPVRAGQAGRGGARPAGGAQRHYPPNLQKLFGVDENGNPVGGGQAGGAGNGGNGELPVNGRNGVVAGDLPGGQDNAGNAGAGAENPQPPKRNPDPRMMDLLSSYRKDAPEGGDKADGGVQHRPQRQLDPEVQKLFDEAPRNDAGAEGQLPQNQGAAMNVPQDPVQAENELNAMLDALGIDPGDQAFERAVEDAYTESETGHAPRREAINIPEGFLDVKELSPEEKEMLPYNDQGEIKRPRELRAAVKAAERAARNGGKPQGEVKAGYGYYADQIKKQEGRKGNNKQPPPLPPKNKK